MNKYLMSGIAALTLCAGFTSCSHDDFEPMTQAEIDKAKYDQAFLNYVGGKIAANQDWGFGATRGLTRAAATWDGNHSCAADWTKLNFTVPEGAEDLTSSDLFPDGNNLGSQFADVTEWYIPAEFEGSLSLHNMNLKGNVYILGKLTDLQSVSCNGVTFYIAKDATMKYTISTGGRQNIVNAGNLEVAKWSNVGVLYNGGTLTVTDTDVHNDATIYSNGEATIEFPYGGDLKSTCDIHGTINVTGNLKIQNSTSKYICGIEATGTVENVDGPFYTSYVKADKFTVDGNQTYLLAGGHIKANTVHVYNTGCSIKAAEGSTALIEAKDFIFANDNDFERTVSDNVYFQISGSIDVKDVTNGNLKKKDKFDNAEAYIEANGNPNDKLNAGTATGSPACGEAWTVGTPTTEKYDLRIIAEDLSADAADDFDFNDVVIDVKFGNPGVIEVKAAGGTLPLRICENDEWEVHKLFNVDQDCMVNTGASAKGLKGQDNLTTAPLQLDFAVNSAADAKAIKIEVYKNNNWQELTAETGKPAAKIAVDTTFDWLGERVSIKEAYPNFQEWVDGTFQSSKWW